LHKGVIITAGFFVVGILIIWGIYFFPFFCVTEYKIEGSFNPKYISVVSQAIAEYRQDKLAACKVTRYEVEKVDSGRACLQGYYQFFSREKPKPTKIDYRKSSSESATLSFPNSCE